MPSRIAMMAQAANARLTVRSAAIERGRLCPRPLYIDLPLIRNRPNANASNGPFLRFAKQMGLQPYAADRWRQRFYSA